jgi:large subunit ribosomal protein L6e
MKAATAKASPAKPAAAAAPAKAAPKAKSAAAKGGRVRNSTLARGINKLGRSQAFSKTGRWRFVKLGDKGKKTPAKAPAAAAVAAPKYYDAEDKPVPHKSRKSAHKPTKLRASITPGTVLILLAGRFRGKRVVFLKQLAKSGLLLVTGPFKANGVPLRRVNQAYVIATSAKVALTGSELPAHVDDAYFARVENNEDKSRNTERYAAWLSKRQNDQKAVDAAVSAAVAKVPSMKEYLSARFSVTLGGAPHLLKF